MSMLVLAAIKLPPEVAIPLAIFGGALIGLALLVLLAAWIGKPACIAIGGLLALYAITTLALGAQLAARKDVLATVEAAREAAAERRLHALAMTPPTTPLADACAAAPSMALADLGVLFKAYDLRSILYRVIDGEFVGDDEDITTWAPSTLDAWYEMATHPLAWRERFTDTRDYRVSRLKFALLVDYKQAALIDLESDRELCSGLLADGLDGTRSLGEDMDPMFARPLVPLCAHIEGDLCPKIRAMAAKW